MSLIWFVQSKIIVLYLVVETSSLWQYV